MGGIGDGGSWATMIQSIGKGSFFSFCSCLIWQNYIGVRLIKNLWMFIEIPQREFGSFVVEMA